MNWYKKSMINPITGETDFDSVDVRRLSGIFARFKDLSEKASEEMNSWLDKNETNITIEEAEKRLRYYLDSMGLS